MHRSGAPNPSSGRAHFGMGAMRAASRPHAAVARSHACWVRRVEVVVLAGSRAIAADAGAPVDEHERHQAWCKAITRWRPPCLVHPKQPPLEIDVVQLEPEQLRAALAAVQRKHVGSTPPPVGSRSAPEFGRGGKRPSATIRSNPVPPLHERCRRCPTQANHAAQIAPRVRDRAARHGPESAPDPGATRPHH
jgi:hypothetical protein